MYNNKLLKPKIDIVFHALFCEENNRLTEALISDILGEDVKIIANMDRHVNIKDANEKLGIMDLRVELTGGIKCNIEIQLNAHKYECERFLYYLANTYARQVSRGGEYDKLHRCISIVIVDYELDLLKDFERLNVKWQMRDDETGKRLLTNNFELIIIELKKARRLYSKNTNDKICQWMLFLDDPNNKEVSHIMNKNEKIKDARQELESVSGNYEIRRIAELKEKYIRDEKAALAYAKEEGFDKGYEEGKLAGINDGMKEGIEKGIEQGIEQGILQTAKNMLDLGISIEDIMKCTNLSREKIEKLK